MLLWYHQRGSQGGDAMRRVGLGVRVVIIAAALSLSAGCDTPKSARTDFTRDVMVPPLPDDAGTDAPMLDDGGPIDDDAN